nr:ABC transporter permease subunit [Ignatzschineria rhizosphaerae]
MSGITSFFDIFTSSYFQAMLVAAKTTISLAIVALVLGFLWANILALLELSRWRIIRWPVTFFVSIIRSLPELIVIFLIGLGLPYLFLEFEDVLPESVVDAYFNLLDTYGEFLFFGLGAFALSLIYASYASQTIRGALLAVPRDQWNSGAVLGLSKPATFFYIVMPQMWRHAFPGLSNQWLVLLKDTALVSLIGVHELMKETDYIYSATADGFTWYAMAALIYLVISLVSQKLQDLLYNRITKYDQEPAK